MPALFLLVSASIDILRRSEPLLSAEGHLVATSQLEEASAMLVAITPDLLVVDASTAPAAEVEFAFRSRRNHSDLPVFVTSAPADPALEAEAKRVGLQLLRAPLYAHDVLQFVRATAREHRRMRVPARRWLRKPVTVIVEVDAGPIRGTIVDMSYGGVKLTFRDRQELPSTFDIRVVGADLTVRAHRVWASGLSSEHFWCGVELDEAGTPPWRAFVDRIRTDRDMS